MTRRSYYFLATVVFTILSLQTLISILLHRPVLGEYIHKELIKFILVIAICGLESSLIENRMARITGIVLTVLLIIGLQWRIMHWPFATEMIIWPVLIIITLNVIFGLREKHKGILSYLLLLYVIQRLLFMLLPNNNLFWWIDVLTGFLISIFGISFFIKKQ